MGKLRKMTVFSTDELQEILVRLPAKSLLRFRSVCKDWYNTIDARNFGQLYLQFQDGGGKELLIRNDKHGKLYSFDLDCCDFYDDEPTPLTMPDVIKVNNLFRPGLSRLSALPWISCHGLILITSRDVNKKWAVWNCYTGDFYQFSVGSSAFIGIMFDITCGIGIGYNATNDSYHIVVIANGYGNGGVLGFGLRTSVLDLRSTEWMGVDDFPDFELTHNEFQHNGLFLNGKLHWIVCDNHSRKLILSYDIEATHHRTMLVPPCLNSKESFEIRLCVLGGHLSLSCYDLHGAHHKGPFDVWMMKDFGRDDSWTKLLSMKQHMVSPRAIHYWKSENQILIHDNNHENDKKRLIWYSVNGIRFNKVKITLKDNIDINFTCQVFPISITRLKHYCTTGNGDFIKAKSNQRMLEDETLDLKLSGNMPFIAHPFIR